MLSNVNNKIISNMEEDEHHGGLLEPALALADDNDHEDDLAFDLDIPPTTGKEYLRRVREEAMSCPQVVVADLDVSRYKAKQTVGAKPKEAMPAPRGYGPSAAWVKMQLDNFVALRQKIIKFKTLLAKKTVTVTNVTLPQSNDAESWCRLCFGRLQLKTNCDMGGGDGEQGGEQGKGEGGEASGGTTTTNRLQNDGTGTPPLLSIVARMDQPTVIKVLEYHVNWMEATGFSHKQGQWFYSLLAVLQKPLTPESCAWLRQLARISSIIRATLNSPEDPVLTELNLLVCLVAHYFDQADMADRT